MPNKLLIAVLAAGASRRLGSPKQLLAVANETLLHRQCRIALQAECGSVLAILGCHAEQCRAAIADLDVACAVNPTWQEGMSSSIRIAAQYAKDHSYDGLLIMLVDQYQLESADLLQISTIWHNAQKQIVVSVSNSYQGPPVVFGATYFDELMKLEGDRGAKNLLRTISASEIIKSAIERAAADCDRIEDMINLVTERSHESLAIQECK
jgi:molybdenum cofactor cytidylyltransferase